MGFAVSYITTEPVEPKLQEAIQDAIQVETNGRTWLSCEPPIPLDQDGFLVGASKPTFSPHPDDVASAEAENAPDGALLDLVDILCNVSATFGIDWELAHDHGPIGFIRGGVCDPNVREQCEALSNLAEMLGGELDFDEF